MMKMGWWRLGLWYREGHAWRGLGAQASSPERAGAGSGEAHQGDGAGCHRQLGSCSPMLGFGVEQPATQDTRLATLPNETAIL